MTTQNISRVAPPAARPHLWIGGRAMSIISRRASYGIRALYRLAERATEGGSATIAWLAENEHLPRKYLEQVVRDLRQAHLVDSRSGPHGGCRLARPADQITVGDVVRALDGEPRPGHCLEEGDDHVEADCPGCWGLKTCAIRGVWLELQVAMNRVLDSTTITDLVLRQAELQSAQADNYQI
jgi:Rrf2 family protein